MAGQASAGSLARGTGDLLRTRLAGFIWLLLASCIAGNAFAQTGTSIVSLTNTVWRFNDTATDLGTAWRGVSYPNENSWPTGRALFGVETSVPYPYPVPIRTPMVLNAGRTTYYFRTHFDFNGNPAGLILRLTAYIDDGAVFYLNGVELHRVRLPAGTIVFSTKAQLATPEGVPVIYDLPAARLSQGANVLAVEVHQYSDTSSDVVFGLALDAIGSQAPAILNPAEPADRTIPEGESTTLSVSASGFPLPGYQWFKNGALIPGATEPNLPLANVSSIDAGNYFCRVTNSAGGVTSRTNVLTFLKDTNGPSILYALGRQNLTEVLVVFSEAPRPEETVDVFNWEIWEAGGGAKVAVDILPALIDPTNLVLTLSSPLDPNASYVLRLTYDLFELVDHGNVLPTGTEVPIAWFETTLIPDDGSQLWRYNQSGSDLGTNWVRPDYDDSGWLTGAGAFDVFRISGVSSACRNPLPGTDEPTRTCLTLSNASNTAQIPTIYFRTRFTFTGDAAHSILRLRTVVNDGAVYYLNGVELARLGMPDGPITYDTLASRTADSFVPEQIDADAPGLLAGTNVLAVELHQINLSSPDFTFGLELLGVVPVKPLDRPRLTFRLTGADLQLNWTPNGGTLGSSDDPSGPWTTVSESHPAGQYTTPLAGAKRFYRVSVP